MVTLSFVIPVYNAGRAVKTALDSICSELKDSGVLAEILVVDDGSTDGTGQLLNEFVQLLNQTIKQSNNQTICTVLRQPNGGVSSARNYGLAQAKGRYAWFVDADDEIARGSLSLLKPVLEGPAGPDVISIGFGADQPQEPPCSSCICPVRDMDEQKDAVWVMRHFGGVLWAWNGIFRREAIAGQRFKEYPNGEDTLWGYEALLAAKTFQRIDAPLYVYRDNDMGASRKMTMRHLESLLAVSFELAEDFRLARHAEWFRPQVLRHVDGMMCNGAMRVVRALGKNGYDIWREGAARVYLQCDSVVGLRRLWYRLVLKFGRPSLLDAVFFKPVEFKARLLKIARGM